MLLSVDDYRRDQPVQNERHNGDRFEKTGMPTIDADPAAAAETLAAAGVELTDGNTPHERWRAARGDAVAVAYDDKIVVQGSNPDDLTLLLRDGGGRGYLYFDGASRGNPGEAAIGWVIITGDGIAAEGSRRIDPTTNNRAEYEALLAGIEAAIDYGLSVVDIRGDSELVVKQVRGEWQTNNPHLREYRIEVRSRLESFDDWSIEHVPRELNEHADDLANEAFAQGP